MHPTALHSDQNVAASGAEKPAGMRANNRACKQSEKRWAAKGEPVKYVVSRAAQYYLIGCPRFVKLLGPHRRPSGP